MHSNDSEESLEGRCMFQIPETSQARNTQLLSVCDEFSCVGHLTIGYTTAFHAGFSVAVENSSTRFQASTIYNVFSFCALHYVQILITARIYLKHTWCQILY